jgi:folate-binding protein YgfZ
MPFCILKHRSILKLTGTDTLKFIQGLITQDINLLELQPILYSLLLSPQGKFQYDLFIWESDSALYIDTDRPDDLYTHLTRFKIRSDVQIEKTSMNVYASLTSISNQSKGTLFKDPRHNDMGFRFYSDVLLDSVLELETYDQHRINFAIPDGTRDMTVDKSIPLEWNMDKLNAISWDKGCYIGQELTSRTKHLDLIKKRVQTLFTKDLPQDPLDKTIRHIKSYGDKCLCFVRFD